MQNIIDKIRSKSREQWLEFAKEKIDFAKQWIDSHGLQAAVLGLVAGVMIVILFKLVFILAITFALLMMFVYIVSNQQSS